MRKILFRGKRSDTAAWETGSLVVIRGGCSDEQVYIADKMTGYHTPVMPSTVGQYVGLDDVNGKMIFEGDVMKFATGQIGCIEWFGNAFTLKFTNYANTKYGSSYGYRYDAAEIVGNIHDNPELVEENHE